MKSPLAALVLATLVASIPAYAHHSFARYYLEDQSVTVEGELYEVTWRSPHAWLYVMAWNEDGEMHMVAAEWANANRLGREGITQDTLRPGDYVIVTGSPGRNPSERKIHLKGLERPADGWTWTQNRP